MLLMDDQEFFFPLLFFLSFLFVRMNGCPIMTRFALFRDRGRDDWLARV